MADFDVGILALTNPPTSAVKTTYRPAVSIRNNGIHDALASGVLRIYKAGLLVFTSEIYSATIPPGETRNAETVDYWLPDVEADFLVIADATCPLDQVEPNNHLAPVTVHVGPGTPPPPPVVTVHAAQHEEGGTDQLSIDGLRGECFDPQPPKNHVSRHAQGGTDELSLTGLHGKAADGQTPALHDNEAHARTFVDAGAVIAAIGVHNATTAPHPTSTNLEFIIRKGAASGYAPLDGTAKVPLVNLPPSQPSLARNQVFSLVDQDTPGPLNVLDTTIADAVLNPGGGLTIDFAAECGIVDTASVWIYLRLRLAGIYDDVFLEAGQELLTAGTWYFDGTFNILGIDYNGPKIIGDMFRTRRLQNSDQASSASMREAGIINYTTGGPIELKLGIALTPVVGDCHINLWRANLRRSA